MKDLFLVEPSKKYQKSFQEYVLTYKNANDDFYYNFYKAALENFDQYICELSDYSKGINIPLDWVAYSTFWLIDHDAVVGVVRIRHQEIEHAGHIGYDVSPYYRKNGYGTQILKLAIKAASEIGISEAIVTCSVSNIASRKIIEKNNGQLLGTVFNEAGNEDLYKFRILTANN